MHEGNLQPARIGPSFDEEHPLIAEERRRHEASAANKPDKTIRIRYTNHRGETAVRRIEPIDIDFDSTEWHPEPQWLLHAFDLDRKAERSFALRDIHEWDVKDLDE